MLDFEVFVVFIVGLLLNQLLLELLRQHLAWDDAFEDTDHLVFELQWHLALLAGFNDLKFLDRGLADVFSVSLQFELANELDVLAFAVELVGVLPEQVVQDGVGFARDALVAEREERHKEDDHV